MSDVAPAGGLLARAAVPTQPAGVPATVINLPPDLARAAAGNILHGTVGGQKVWPVRFFLRRGRGQAKEAENRAAATQFIVEVELSRIGDLQLDGLVRPRRFDPILRTRAPLPHHMRRDIAAIYESANEVGGTTGQIAFQANQAWRPMPLDRESTESNALLI